MNTIKQTPLDCPRDKSATCSHLGVYISIDGAATWTADHPFGTLDAAVDLQIGFGPDGVLHAVGISSSASDLLLFDHTFARYAIMARTVAVINTRATERDWLAIARQTGVL